MKEFFASVPAGSQLLFGTRLLKIYGSIPLKIYIITSGCTIRGSGSSDRRMDKAVPILTNSEFLDRLYVKGIKNDLIHILLTDQISMSVGSTC